MKQEEIWYNKGAIGKLASDYASLLAENEKLKDKITDLHEQKETLETELEETKKSSKQWFDKAMGKHNQIRLLNKRIIEAAECNDQDNMTNKDIIKSLQSQLEASQARVSKQVIDANEPEYLLGILKNIERNMPKAWRKRTSNAVIVKDFLMTHTNKGGRTSSYEMCEYLGINGDANYF